MTRSIEQAFGEIDLPVPQISARWASRLREREPWLFCTGKPPETSLNDFEEFVESALDGTVENGLWIGRQGYGVNNWMLHYYLVEDDLLVLLQRRWGNIYDDEEERRSDLLTTFASLANLLAEVSRVRAAGIELPGRLTVLHGVQDEPRWNFTAAPPPVTMLRINRSLCRRSCCRGIRRTTCSRRRRTT
jgi:hypothetical protein